MLRNGNAPSANNASTGLRSDEHDDDGDHRQDAGDRQRDQQHDVVDLLDVGVRVRHQLAGLRAVVEREVQTLQVRDETHAQVGLDAVRELERGVAAEAGADGLHRADDEDEPCIFIAVSYSPGVMPSSMARPVSAGMATRATVQTRPAPMPSQTNTLMRPYCRSHEPPAVPRAPPVLRPPIPPYAAVGGYQARS